MFVSVEVFVTFHVLVEILIRLDLGLVLLLELFKLREFGLESAIGSLLSGETRNFTLSVGIKFLSGHLVDASTTALVKNGWLPCNFRRFFRAFEV